MWEQSLTLATRGWLAKVPPCVSLTTCDRASAATFGAWVDESGCWIRIAALKT